MFCLLYFITFVGRVYVTILEKGCFLVVGEVVLCKQVKCTRRKFYRATRIGISVLGNEGTRIVANISYLL